MSPCITDDELVTMLDGGLTPERAEQLLAHVDACPTCAQVVAELGMFEGGPTRTFGRYMLEGVARAAWMGRRL